MLGIVLSAIMQSVTMLTVIMQSVVKPFKAVAQFISLRLLCYAERHYADCRYAECRGAI
jgi:hypothetical protein